MYINVTGRFFIIIMLFIIMTGCREVNSNNKDKLFIKLNIISKEKGPDSYSDEYSAVINGNFVTWKWTHKGFPDFKSRYKCYFIGRKKIDFLIDYINNNNLNRNIIESKPVDLPGLAVFVEVEIRLGEDKTAASITGMYNDWSSPDKEHSNLDNLDYYYDIDHLVKEIEFGLKDL